MAKKLSKSALRHRRFAQTHYQSIEREHLQQKEAAAKAISTLRGEQQH